MNDDFLHRMRKAPPPKFLEELKSRLDRQPKVPPERPRFGFGRGMIVGLLVAGASFALASVSLGGWPTSARQFFSVPVEYVVQIWQHGHEQEAEQARMKAQPLGPAWFPTHVNTQPASGPAPDSAEAIAVPIGPGSNTAGANGSPATSTATQAAGPGALAKTLSGFRVGAQRDVYSFVRNRLRNVSVTEVSGADSFGYLCNTYSTRPLPQNIISTRHITADPACKSQHFPRIMELKLGYLAVVLVRSKLYAPMYLSPRTLFLALARRVPDPAHPNQLIDNPYTTWSSTWNNSGPTLPEDSIQFYGPAQDSPAGRLAAQLLLDAGCNSIPALVSMRDHNDPEFESVCHELRTDAHYTEIPPSSDLVEMLNINPTAIAIVSLPWFQTVKARLNANPINEVSPDYAALNSQRYPLAQTLYFDTVGMPVYWMRPLFDELVAPFYDNNGSTLTWGFVPLDTDESTLNRAIFETQKFVQF